MSVERRRGHGGDPSRMVREVWCERGAHARVHAGLHGWITLTELSSDDPVATRDWCAGVLGWGFQPVFASPAGDYHLFAYSAQGGGGIRQPHPARQQAARPPCAWTTPTRRIRPRWRRSGVGRVAAQRQSGVRIALVRAPGGVLIGLSGPTD